MTRSSFLGSMLAMFAGVALPVSVREQIWVPKPVELYSTSASAAADLEAMWRQIQISVVESFEFGVTEWQTLDAKLKRTDLSWRTSDLMFEVNL